MDATKALYTSIGKHIRETRERRGLTQKALASLVHLTRTSITNIERGGQKLLVHTLVDIAKALNVAPAVLLAQKEKDENTSFTFEDLLKGMPKNEREWIKATINASEKGG